MLLWKCLYHVEHTRKNLQMTPLCLCLWDHIRYENYFCLITPKSLRLNEKLYTAKQLLFNSSQIHIQNNF
jgi:hypothetical protein